MGEATTATTNVTATAGPSREDDPLGGIEFRPRTPTRKETDRWRRRAEEGDAGSSSSASGSGEVGGQEGPMTPMNDAGPFVLDGGEALRHAELE